MRENVCYSLGLFQTCPDHAFPRVLVGLDVGPGGTERFPGLEWDKSETETDREGARKGWEEEEEDEIRIGETQNW